MDDSVQELELDAIAPGTVLASDLLESSGKVLVMAGTALTAEMLEAARREGITRIRVKGEEGSGEAEQERCESRLKYLFRNTAGNGPAEELHRLLIVYRQGGQE